MCPIGLFNSLCVHLFPWCRARLIEQVGGEIARECRAELWERVHVQVAYMSVPEIRGYVRAHAAGIAAAQVEDVLGRRSLRPSLAAGVLAAGIEQLVHLTVRDALMGEPASEARTLAA
jgi:hypothetical protein